MFSLLKRLFGKVQPQTIHFGDHQAALLEVAPDTPPTQALKDLGLPPYNAAVVIHSGAAGMSDDYLDKLRQLFTEGLAPLAEEKQLLVVDGATDTGCMTLIGAAREAINGTFPLLGVTISGSITYPGGPPNTDDRWPLESRHSHFLIARAEDFGAESPLITGVASVGGVPRLAMIVNGGEIVKKEAAVHARQGTPLLVLKGSGRFADELANSRPDSPLRASYPSTAVIRVFDVEQGTPQQFRAVLSEMLFGT